MKEESLRDLGKVYYLDDQEVLTVEKKNQTDLVMKSDWRKALPNVTFEQLLRANDVIRDVLLNIKFSDSRTIANLHRFGLASQEVIAYSPSQFTMTFPENIWSQIEKIAFSTPTPATEYILSQYQKNSWSLQEDLSTENALRQFTKASIPLKMTKVEPGSRLINAGEKVTHRHIEMLRGMKKALSEKRHLASPLTMLGSLMLSLVLTFVGVIYFKTLYPKITKSLSKIGLIVTVFLFTLLIAKITERFLLHQSGFDLYRYPIFVLFVTLTLSVLINKGVAIIVSTFAALVLTITLALDYQHFMIINFSTAFMGIVVVKRIKKRNDIFKACAKIWLTIIPLILSLNLLENSLWDYHLIADCLTTFVSIGITGGLVVGLLPFLESVFGVVTDMTLMEAADPSHPLLRRLSLQAIGTYQHSLSVAVLAEELALAINANTLLCRTAGLYHDIGKLNQPDHFIENQFFGPNVHQSLTSIESAQLIISHVAEGVKLAQYHELPANVIEVIQEHHGTGLVYYFYQARAKELGRAVDEVEEEQFRYPGPRPRSRESAIIMIADSIEAASRSLGEITEKSVSEFIEKIIMDKIQQKQLDNSHLTFNEIEVIKKTLIRALLANSHRRIKYPISDEKKGNLKSKLA